MRNSQHHSLFADLGRRLDREGERRLSTQVSQFVAEKIAAGELGPGDQIPPQRELSRICGVSEVTIRRALQELAEQGMLEARAGGGTIVLGPTGRPGRAGGVMSLGIAFADLTDGYPFFRPMLEGIRDAASDAAGETPGREVATQLFDLPGEPSPDAADAARLHGLDGLLMMSPVNVHLVARCQRERLPYVLLYNDLADGASHCVVVDYSPGVAQAVRHLVEQGRRRIALVTASEPRFSTGQLEDAFTAAMDLFSSSDQLRSTIHAGYGERDGYRATLSLLEPKQRPHAIIFASDEQARGGLIAARERGLAVPHDLAVIGAGRLIGDNGWPVPMTSIDLGFREVGAAAYRMLQELIAGKPNLRRRVVVRSSLYQGQTA